MKHVILVLISALCLSNTVMAKSQIFETRTITSKILESDRNYSIYLPDGYNESDRSYPVLYLLHGSGDDHTGWVQFGEVQRIADQAIASGKSAPMIIVMPDANSGKKGYYNSPEGDFQYEDFFFTELIPQIEKEYRCRSEKQFRAIAGLSMGGGGTLIYALHHPEIFSSACALSASVTDKSNIEHFKKFYEVKSDSKMTEWFKQYNTIELIKTMPENQKKAVRWYIDCGDDDYLYQGSSTLHTEMRNNNIPHEFRIRNGDHSWAYWRESLPEVLNFISTTFKRQ